MQNKCIQLRESVSVLCEEANVVEEFDNEGNVKSVYVGGVAITFHKPTRNRVSYTQVTGEAQMNTLIGKPFLDTHNDTSIRTHPPFGHVIEVSKGINEKNNMPCLNYRVDLDPEETSFIRKLKRKDIPGVSIQVLVDSVTEKEDNFGSFLEANIREYLELSAVLIPGDGDSSITITEKFHAMKEGVITPDGVLSRKKVLAKDAIGVDNEEDPDEDLPVMPIKPRITRQGLEEDEDNIKVIQPKLPDPDKPEEFRFTGKRKTEAAWKGCKCPDCGRQMLKDSYSNGVRLRCYKCNFIIESKRLSKMTVMPIKNRKEMNMDGIEPTAPTAPVTPEAPEIPDHTHPEYDQLLIKIQELEDLVKSPMDSISFERMKKRVESLEEGKPEDDKGKPTGEVKDPANVNQESTVNSIVRKVVEELKGIPERDTGKQLDTAGPENTDGIPQSVQPPVGTAPSGGNFDSDDKLNDADGDVVVGKVSKPVSDYEKGAIVKNKMARAKSLIERAKRLMKEANEPDPTQPNPGKTEKDPKKMDGQLPNKSPSGGTEAVNEDDDDDEDKDDTEKMVEKVMRGLKQEIKREKFAERRTMMGGSQGRQFAGKSNLTTGATEARHGDYMSARKATANTIQEYLNRV